MSTEANALLLNLLASGIDAVGVHCNSPTPTPTPTPPPYDPDEPSDRPDDKGGKKIRFL
jgi:hypothetical protein